MTKPTRKAAARSLHIDQLAHVRGGVNSVGELRSQFISLGGIKPTRPTQPSTDGLSSSLSKAANK